MLSYPSFMTFYMFIYKPNGLMGYPWTYVDGECCCFTHTHTHTHILFLDVCPKKIQLCGTHLFDFFLVLGCVKIYRDMIAKYYAFYPNI
jgi:hypothetical protein